MIVCSEIAGRQQDEIETLTAQHEAEQWHRMEEINQQHVKQAHAMKGKLEQALSQLEDKNAELVVANGIAAAASAQAEEHLHILQSIQSELKSAKMALQLQQEQLKHQAAELQDEQAAWMQEKSLIMMQRQQDEQELKLLQQKLSRGLAIEEKALSVRSIVKTTRALHPGSRIFSLWVARVRGQQRLLCQRMELVQKLKVMTDFYRKRMVKSVVLHWRKWQQRNSVLMHMEFAVTCLILQRRLKNFFGLWFQTAGPFNSLRIRGSHPFAENLLSTRVSRFLISNAFLYREQNSQSVALLSHVIRAFSSVECSTALRSASVSFKAFYSGVGTPSNLSSEAKELCLLLSACLKCTVEEAMKPNLHVSCNYIMCVLMLIFIARQNLNWSEVLRALSAVSSNYSKLMSITSSARLRSAMPDQPHLSIRDLPKSSDFEFNLLLVFSRSIVMSAAEEISASIVLPVQRIPVSSKNLMCRRFCSGFISCMRGYKQAVDAMRVMRRETSERVLRRLQGGLLVSKVYVNSLVSYCERSSACMPFVRPHSPCLVSQICFHLSEEIHYQAALHRPLPHAADQSITSIPSPPSVAPTDPLWWFSDSEMNRHGIVDITAFTFSRLIS